MTPTDVPKADTLKRFTKKEYATEQWKAATAAKKAENQKTHYRQMLEMNWKVDSTFQKSMNKKAIEDGMKRYENATDSLQLEIYLQQRKIYKQQIDSILNENTKRRNQEKSKAGDEEANLFLSIQNTKITGDTLNPPELWVDSSAFF